MNSINLYQDFCKRCSKQMTHLYSSSFSMGIRLFAKPFRNPICAIYGFVRLADEIVDSFHHLKQEELLLQFRKETQAALSQSFSLNPILQNFQEVVHRYNIPFHLIDSFLDSMQMDLYKKTFSASELEDYVYGSAEVVGLMCLCVFVEGDAAKYETLKPYARSLGSAFQKINFLRDIKSDYEERGRVYFPNLNIHQFSLDSKREIEQIIQEEFQYALKGIHQLPKSVRLGVYIAFTYYWRLFIKIQLASPEQLLQKRFRIQPFQKILLLTKSYLQAPFIFNRG